MAICQQCKREYFGKRSDSLFCSKKCGRRHHYLNNKQEYILRAENWAENNKEKRKEIMHKFNTSDKSRLKHKKFYQKNCLRINKLAQLNRVKNIDICRAKTNMMQRKRRHTPQGKLKMMEENKRRALSKSLWYTSKKSGTIICDKIKRQITQRLKFMESCVYCNSRKKLAIDHIFSLKIYNNNEPENLVIACRSCNSSKKDMHVIQWAKKTNKILPNIVLDYVKKYEGGLNGENTI